MKSIVSATREIRNLPYDVGAWSSRGQCLMHIGYPELAVGDAYKATLLFDEIHNDSSLGRTALLMFGMKHWLSLDPSSRDAAPADENFLPDVWALLTQIEIDNSKVLVEALIHLNCPCDAQEVCREASRSFPAEGYFRGRILIELNELKRSILSSPMPSSYQPEQHGDWIAALRYGRFYRRSYPWMNSEMVRRDPSAINKMRKSIADHVTTKLTIKKISENERPDETESDYYGMFAKTNLNRGQVIFKEGTVICGAITGRCPACCGALNNRPHLSECCQTPYCTARCANLAAQTYHASICKKDFSFLNVNKSPNTIVLQEQLRVFAVILQENASHPLKSTILAPLHAQLGPDNTMAASLKGTIMPTIKTLRALGIDIFADEKWDTWVLFIILARLANNHRADNLSNDGFLMAINPYYSFINHSCDPNAQYSGMSDDSSVTVFAIKPIAKGEEICVSYLNSNDRKLGVKDRQNLLRAWVGEMCFCQKCKVERDTLT